MYASMSRTNSASFLANGLLGIVWEPPCVPSSSSRNSFAIRSRPVKHVGHGFPVPRPLRGSKSAFPLKLFFLTQAFRSVLWAW